MTVNCLIIFNSLFKPQIVLNLANTVTIKDIGATIKGEHSLKKKKIHIHSVLRSHTVPLKLSPYGRYRQLNSVLYPNNYKLKSSKIILNGLVLK